MSKRLAIGVAGVLLLTCGAPADVYTWDAGGGATNNWTTQANWNPETAIPGAGDEAQFSLTGTRTVTVDAASQDIDTMTFTSSGAWTFAPATSTLTVATAFNYGSTGSSTFNPILAGAGALNVTSGTLTLSNANSYSGAVTLSGTGVLSLSNRLALQGVTVTVNPGARVQQYWPSGQTGGFNVVLKGGTYRVVASGSASTANHNTGTVDLQVDSYLTGVGDGASACNLSGKVTGAGKLTFDATGSTTSDTGTALTLSNGDNDYSGGTVVETGRLIVSANGALGTGAVVVNSGDHYGYTGLRIQADQTVRYPSSITINPTGMIGIESDFSRPITVEAGGRILGFTNASRNMSGNITLDGDTKVGTVSGTSSLRLTGQILETAGQHYKVICDVDGTGSVYLENATNAFTGGVDLLAGKTRVVTAGALSTGNVYVGGVLQNYGGFGVDRRGGRLETAGAGSLNSVLNASHTVTIDAEGAISFGSAELASAGQKVTVKPGGAMLQSAAGTAYTYGAGGTIDLWKGAIIDDSIPTKPTRGEIDGLTQGTGFGVYLGKNGNVTTAYTVGDDGAGTLYRGLAAVNASSTLTYYGVLTEATGSTAGVQLYSQATGTFNIGRQGTGQATITTNGSNPLVLNGAGSFVLDGVNTLPDTIEQRGSWMVRADDADSLPTGKTLHLYSGWLDLNNAAAVSTGATVNFHGGAAFVVDQTLTTGSFHFDADSGAFVTSDAQLQGLRTLSTWDEGSHLILSGGFTSTTLPGPGLTNYTLYHGNATATITLGGVVLGNNTRVMNTPTFAGVGRGTGGISSSSGAITLLAGQNQGTLAAVRGTNLLFSNVIDFDGGKLIVGDTTGQWTTIADQGKYGLVTAYTDGSVQLANTGNDIGSMDIRSGTLRVDALGHLGGAKAFNIGTLGTLQLDYDNPGLTGAAFTGSGKVLVGNNASGTSTMTLTGGSISPGNSAGKLTIDGNLTVAATDPFTLTIQVVGGSLTPGVGFDQLAVDILTSTGSTNRLANIDLVVDIQGAGGITPGDQLVILTTASDLTGMSFKSVSGFNEADIIYGNGFVALTNVPEPATMGLLACGFLPLVLRRRRR